MRDVMVVLRRLDADEHVVAHFIVLQHDSGNLAAVERHVHALAALESEARNGLEARTDELFATVLARRLVGKRDSVDILVVSVRFGRLNNTWHVEAVCRRGAHTRAQDRALRQPLARRHVAEASSPHA